MTGWVSGRAWWRSWGVALSALGAVAAIPTSPVAEAERLAAQAVAAQTPLAERLELARRALGLTPTFDPTHFAQAGRKGEVVEDVFVSARNAYRRHRAVLYAAAGDALAANERLSAALSYHRRAFDLDPEGGRRAAFAATLDRLQRFDEARSVLLGAVPGQVAPADLAVLTRIADRAGLPSVQAEIDRARIEALRSTARFRYGPLTAPPGSRLSTGAPLRLDSAPISVLYVADAGCRSCSRDLEAIQRHAPAAAQVVLVPASRDDDTALRRSLALYGRKWPVLVGDSLAAALGATAPSVLLVARDAVVVVEVPSPVEQTLPPVLAALARVDVQETRPRPQWNRRTPSLPRSNPNTPLLPNGLAPAEEGSSPDAVAAAAADFDAKRPAEALAAFEKIGSRDDGSLLAPEVDYNRALCLAAMGRADQARRILLGVGDSRFQSEVDRALERSGSPARGSRPK